MKRELILVIVMLCIALFNVNISAKQLLPVRRDATSRWCVVDSKGKFYYENRFDGISESGEGTFVVRDSDSRWSVYAYAKGEPRLIAGNLASVGNFSEGLMAVTRINGDPIEIIDKQGKTVFTLDTICGKSVARCSYCHYGRFVVTTVDRNGKVEMGMVDMEGKTVLAPTYKELYACAGGQFCGRTLRNGKTEMEVLVPDGRGGYMIRKAAKKTYRVENYAVMPFDNGTWVLNLGNVKDLVELPANIAVQYANDRFVVYKRKDANGVYVYNRAKRQTMPFEDSQSVVVTKRGLLSVSEIEEGVSLFTLDGKFVRKTEWQYVVRYGDFVIAYRNDGVNLLDKNIKPLLKTDCNAFAFFAEPGYEYSPSRIMSSQMISSLIIDNLRMMVDSGAVVGDKMKDCAFESKTILDINGQTVECLVFKGENDVIKKALIGFSDTWSINDPLTEVYYSFLEAAIKVKMDREFKKVAEGIYEDNGVFYHIINGTFIIVSRTMECLH